MKPILQGIKLMLIGLALILFGLCNLLLPISELYFIFGSDYDESNDWIFNTLFVISAVVGWVSPMVGMVLVYLGIRKKSSDDDEYEYDESQESEESEVSEKANNENKTAEV